MRPSRRCPVSSASAVSSSAMTPSTPSRRRSASPRLATRGRGSGLGALSTRGLLDLHHLAIDLVGDADAARLRQRAGVFLDQHRAVDRAAGAVVAERAFGARGREHALEALLEEHGLEILRSLAGLVGP